MNAFRQFAKRLLHYRATLIWALVFAFFSAASLGAGLVSLAPMMQVILDEDREKSLVTMAENYNAGEPWLEIPQAVVRRLPGDPFQGVLLIIIVVATLTVVGAAANFLHQYLSRTVSTRAIADIREQTFRHVMYLPLMRVVQRGPSQLVARIIRDTTELHKGFIALTSKSVAQITKGLAAFGAALWFDFGLALAAVIVVPLLAYVLRKVGKRIRRGTRGALQAQEGLLRITSEMLQGLRSVKANTGENEAMRRFSTTNQEVIRQELRVRTAKSLSAPLLETLAVFVIAALALFAAHRILAGTITVDGFLLTLAALGVAGGSFRPLAGLVNEVQAATAPAVRLQELLDELPEQPAGHEQRTLPRHHQSIEFEEISLTYPGAVQPALDGITLRVLHGERIAIVGPNGSGKTTLLSLLPRLLTPDNGCVSIDGVDIARVDINVLRQQIGVVTQETVLFHGTVADNIVFGSEGTFSREQVIEAARQARADEFIRRIPGGYDADLLEQGASLSGGQRQRLAIARAILRDPAILILDEATSQIDAESEELITEALGDFSAGRTTLIIAHRLSTVRGADRIVVLDRGRVVDEGTHDQLLGRCALYTRLSRTQLAISSP